jgi:hypothetical protein
VCICSIIVSIIVIHDTYLLVQVHFVQLGRVHLALLAAAVPAQRRARHLVLWHGRCVGLLGEESRE